MSKEIMYCYDGHFFFTDLYELVEHFYFESLEQLKEDFPQGIEVNICELQPICIFTPEKITWCIDDDRYPEEDEKVYNKVIEALNKHIDFEKLNADMPQLWYATESKELFPLEELIEVYE